MFTVLGCVCVCVLCRVSAVFALGAVLLIYSAYFPASPPTASTTALTSEAKQAAGSDTTRAAHHAEPTVPGSAFRRSLLYLPPALSFNSDDGGAHRTARRLSRQASTSLATLCSPIRLSVQVGI